MAREPTVFVVDDDAAMRDSLRWLLESVGLRGETYATGEEFLDTYDPRQPGCLILDVRMPGMSGLSLQDTLAAQDITLPVIIITGYAEVPTAVRALKSGAIDFIQKPFNDDVLLERVRQALETDRQTRELQARRAEAAARFALLTPRERQVMDLVIAGKANKVMATELGLSPKTVEVHRANVMAKMEVDSVAELVRLGMLLTPQAGLQSG
jgi:two-component system, LuxR family, response regulator FixJ